MNGVVPSTRRHRFRLARVQRAAAMTVAFALPLVAASSSPAASHVAQGPVHPVAPTPPQIAAFTPADVAASVGDLRDFRAVARKPAPSAPIRRLPKVNLATVDVTGIPPVVAGAYVSAARTVAGSDPSCGLHWWLLAGIGFVESGHAHSGGSGNAHWDGVARPPILGPVLDGSGGFAPIRDTDHGHYDGNTRWDRAVGPMQFLPSTWETWGVPRPGAPPGNPQAIGAATLATARYLCASGRDLSQVHNMALAVFSYNHSFDYVRLVLSVAARYAGLDPAALGVNALPTDKQARHRRHAHRRHKRARAHARGTTAASGTRPTASPAPSPAASPSASPSPSPSSAPLPNPLARPSSSPSPKPTVLPTLPVMLR